MQDSPLERIPRTFVPVDAAETSAPPFEHSHTVPRDHWRVLMRRRWLIAGFFLTVVLLVGLHSLVATRIYTAETVLLLERRPPRISDIESILAESLGPQQLDYYETQYEILKSRSLAAQVIREERLEEMLSNSEAPQPPGHRVAPQAVGWYLKKWLEVSPMRRTRLVKLSLSTPDPELSARVLGAHVQAYIRQGLDLRALANEEARGFLEESLAGLKQRVERSEAALNAYRREKGIVSLDGKENVTIERLADLSQRLTEAEADRIAHEAQVHLIRSRAYDSLPAVISSTLVGTLKGQLAQLEGEYANLSTRFQPGYSRLAQLRAQVLETRRRLRQEVQSIVEGIESTYLAAVTREEKLRATFEEQKSAALELKDAAVEYAILEREADTNRQLYDSVFERMKEMGVVAELRTPNAYIIDEALAPTRPSRPRTVRNVSLAILLGLAGGFGLALLAEYLDDTVKSPEEVGCHLGVATLGVVPHLMELGGVGRSQRTPVRQLVSSVLRSGKRPDALELAVSPDAGLEIMESYRSLRTAILLSHAAEPPRTILFTSATRGEGKTVTTLNAAIMFAQLGPPVLVIDADLRRPRCHRGLGVENALGLTEVLTGQIRADAAICATSTSLSYLLSGATPPNPTELLGSRLMGEILATLRQHFAYVLIDSPPLLPVSDSVVLSKLVDGVVLVVDQTETRRQMAREALARLASARAKVLGVVLNKADLQTPGYYGGYS